MSFHVPNKDRIKKGEMGSTPAIGNNGAFEFMLDGIQFFCIASDQMGWEHVSVTIDRNRCPTWEQMCKVKAIFWDEDDCVVQYHPAKKDYVSYHPYCLHLWRPVGIELPVPPSIFVGPKKGAEVGNAERSL